MRQVWVWWLKNLWKIASHNRGKWYTSYFKLSFSVLKFHLWSNPQSMEFTLPFHFSSTNSPAMPRKVHQIRSQESWIIILDTDPFLICGLIFILSQMRMWIRSFRVFKHSVILFLIKTNSLYYALETQIQKMKSLSSE